MRQVAARYAPFMRWRRGSCRWVRGRALGAAMDAPPEPVRETPPPRDALVGGRAIPDDATALDPVVRSTREPPVPDRALERYGLPVVGEVVAVGSEPHPGLFAASARAQMHGRAERQRHVEHAG